MGYKQLFRILIVMVVVAVLLFIAGMANKNNHGGAEANASEPPAMSGMSCFYGQLNCYFGQKRLSEPEKSRESGLQTRNFDAAGKETIAKEPRSIKKREEVKKDAEKREVRQEHSKNKRTNIHRNDRKIKFKRVALTFDDGPHPIYTEEILKLLKKYNAKATFFMLGSNVEKYPEIAAKIAEEGHELGNHTWNHHDMTAHDHENIAAEIAETNKVIEKATGEKPTLFRPPYGAMNEQLKTAIKMMPVMWTVDTLDWKASTPEEIVETVRNNVEDGSIILLHDIHEVTVEALDLILKYLDGEGFDFVRVSDLEKY